MIPSIEYFPPYYCQRIFILWISLTINCFIKASIIIAFSCLFMGFFLLHIYHILFSEFLPSISHQGFLNHKFLIEVQVQVTLILQKNLWTIDIGLEHLQSTLIIAKIEANILLSFLILFKIDGNFESEKSIIVLFWPNRQIIVLQIDVFFVRMIVLIFFTL